MDYLEISDPIKDISELEEGCYYLVRLPSLEPYLNPPPHKRVWRLGLLEKHLGRMCIFRVKLGGRGLIDARYMTTCVSSPVDVRRIKDGDTLDEMVREFESF